mmetsp:Transcript_139653/g.243040  ORF Transcript_139653/g.243040 Transcript_139653/m.243040 type:complete len:290 (-) Transcript_139653:833-1702(-)
MLRLELAQAELAASRGTPWSPIPTSMLATELHHMRTVTHRGEPWSPEFRHQLQNQADSTTCCVMAALASLALMVIDLGLNWDYELYLAKCETVLEGSETEEQSVQQGLRLVVERLKLEWPSQASSTQLPFRMQPKEVSARIEQLCATLVAAEAFQVAVLVEDWRVLEALETAIKGERRSGKKKKANILGRGTDLKLGQKYPTGITYAPHYLAPELGYEQQAVIISGFLQLEQGPQRQLLHTLVGKCDLKARLLFLCQSPRDLQDVKAVLWDFQNHLLCWGMRWGVSSYS